MLGACDLISQCSSWPSGCLVHPPSLACLNRFQVSLFLCSVLLLLGPQGVLVVVSDWIRALDRTERKAPRPYLSLCVCSSMTFLHPLGPISTSLVAPLDLLCHLIPLGMVIPKESIRLSLAIGRVSGCISAEHSCGVGSGCGVQSSWMNGWVWRSLGRNLVLV